MRRGKNGNLALHAEVLRVEPREVVDRSVHEGEVGAPLTEQAGLLADLAEEHLHPRRPGAGRECAEDALQQLVRGAGLRGQHQRALGGPGAPGAAHRGPERVEDLPGVAGEHPPGVGEDHAARASDEELDAEPALQLADRP
ncbi:hypothetical protein SAMN05216184_11745 [Georgenia satyanarayanai]|uniref:Uncharacterized protein n=1 Tax=Georgenia satyanarayanai TaxID=860221 RepID=A0A2Y9C7Q6_9MICO|nr:hypothetical protein A8987_11745 [Georgenia satyanarayanai]SSA46423.1 hypothetical protein SAMN05216184_11745 [Georgenia satyanarayanai]